MKLVTATVKVTFVVERVVEVPGDLTDAGQWTTYLEGLIGEGGLFLPPLTNPTFIDVTDVMEYKDDDQNDDGDPAPGTDDAGSKGDEGAVRAPAVGGAHGDVVGEGHL